MAMIAPSILSADFSRLCEEVKAAEEAGADVIHVDVMDGMFVPNITIGPLIVKAVHRCSSLPLDVHLMIEKPERYVPEFVQAGAHWLTVHAEACTHLHRTLEHIREEGARCGVALNPATPLTAIDYVLDDLDLVLVMSVNPGFGGQEFIPESLRKLRTLRDTLKARSLSPIVAVDGGIKPENIGAVAEAGAELFVMGSAFYGAKDYGAVVRKSRENLGDA
ncbi:MAG: ribulose-phosphate 3-epimerase [Nitrospirota bacterium]|jgi:ribulose-phosphate 3-epimerase